MIKPKQNNIGQQLAQQMFEKLGIDPKTGKPLSKRKSRSTLGEDKGVAPTRPPFRIKALEKTKRQSPRGKAYKYSPLFRNAVILRLLVKKFTEGLSPKKYHRLIDQLNSSGRSVFANIREGYLRPSSAEYSIFLGYSHGSLEEIRGDVEDTRDDGLLKSKPGSSLAGIGIELKPLSSPKSSYKPPKSSYDPLGEHKRKIRGIKREQLSYEIFIELINKTDYLLKRAVEGLDKKIIADEEKKLKEKLEAHWSKNW